MNNSNNLISLFEIFVGKEDSVVGGIFSTVVVVGVILATIAIVDYRYVSQSGFDIKAIGMVRREITVYVLSLYLFVLLMAHDILGTFNLLPNGIPSEFGVREALFSAAFLLTLIMFLVLGPETRLVRLEEHLLFTVLGLTGPAFFSVHHLIGFYIILEILTFIFFTLVGITNFYSKIGGPQYLVDTGVVEGAIRYLFPSLFSSIVTLLGLCLIYSVTLTLDSVKIVEMLQTDMFVNNDSQSKFCLTLGVLLLISSFMFKLGVGPLHRWVFGIYGGLPVHTVFLLATVAKVVYFLGFVKVILPIVIAAGQIYLLLVIGLISLVVGTLHGIFERRFMIIIASSGVLNMGYVVVAIGVGGPQGTALAVFSLLVYVIIILFLASLIYCLDNQIIGSLGKYKTMNDFLGLVASTPQIAFGIIIALFALIGVPPLIGFYPKFLIFVYLVLVDYPLAITWLFLLCIIISSYMYFKLILSSTKLLPKLTLKTLLMASLINNKHQDAFLITLLMIGLSFVVDFLCIYVTLCVI